MKNKFSIIVFFLVFSLTSGHMVYGTTIGTNIDISNNLTVGGNVGIGDSSPSSKLVIKSNDYRDFISLDRTGDASVDQIWEISPSTDGSSPSGSLRFISGGSVITSFLSSGNVGIGINVPTYKLDVSGTFRATGNSYIGGNLGLGKTPSYKLDVEGAVNVSTVNAAVGTHAVTVDYVSTALDNFEATIDPSKWTTSGNNIYSSNTGNVGIGQTSPSYKLDITGTFRATGNWLLGGAAQGDLNMNNRNITGANRITIADPGINEGISWTGTSAGWTIDVSPEARTNADGNLNFYGTSNDVVIWRPTKLKGTASNLIVEGTGNSSISGSLGVGTTSPSGKLTVRQNMSSFATSFSSPHLRLEPANNTDNTGFVGVTYGASTSDNYGWSVGSLRSTNGQSSFVWKHHNNSSAGTEYLRITQTGNVGIGTSNPSYPLEVNGDVSADAFLYNSDIRFKNNISPIADSLSKITNLNGISYNLKDNNYRSVGLSAQEVQKNIPDAVRKDDNGNLSIDPSALIANLVEAIKEQQNQIEKQGSRIDELEKQLKLK